jgi:hypothetical protein
MSSFKAQVLFGRTESVPVVLFRDKPSLVVNLQEPQATAYSSSKFFPVVRIFDMRSLVALGASVRAGVFGRGSVHRFHLSIFTDGNPVYVFPLFAVNKERVTIVNKIGYEQYLIEESMRLIDSLDNLTTGIL